MKIQDRIVPSGISSLKVRMKKKIQSQKGESLSEVLVASLVLALGMILLATMMSSSYKMVNRSKTSFSNYYEKVNELEKRTGTSVTTGEVEIDITEKGSLGIPNIAIKKIPALSVDPGNGKLTMFGF